ncbi:MAG: hypothetical protein A2Z06_03140 [Candidatus Glassbacteria bacterium RBG_16_58_8]|uniref:Bacterial surface antigen (D15) domain-containing protein n=1 Tax=Candidatus Glassbacteria bacterium RBG_16_58_8 TaxID=1817866 RepID=A0A1F5YCC5_9BACT|nr:MAG: hypothetical protein A2Z06_03140 [Candidatus Glassbacteria bacterium RBG_16_58_8]
MKRVHPDEPRTEVRTLGLSLLTLLLLTGEPSSSPLVTGTDSFEAPFSDALFLELKGFKGFSIREFNRADGFLPTFQLGIRSLEEGKYPSASLSLSYSIERERAGWKATIGKPFQGWGDFRTSLDAYRLTETNDRWRISDLENSIAAFMFKEDFRNYYETEGFRLSAEMGLGDFHRVTMAYVDQHIRSLGANEPFTLFGWAKEFRENPPVSEGEERKILFEWTYDTRDNIRFPRRGWHATLSYETCPAGLHGDFAYRLLTAQLRRYRIVFGDQSLNFRLAMALSGNSPPAHRRFTIGGVGTLRGFPDLSDAGENFLMGNAEYRCPIRWLTWKPLRLVFNEIQGLLFFDIGDAWSEGGEAGQLRSDIGLGISGANIFSYFGLYIAQGLESPWRDPRVTVKMEREF